MMGTHSDVDVVLASTVTLDPVTTSPDSRMAQSDLNIRSNRLPASRFDAATCSRGGSCLKVIGARGGR